MNKKLSNASALYLEGIRDGNVRAAIEAYSGERYTQHSTGVADGAEGFIAFFEGTDMATFDIFRLADGLIVEHWDNMEQVPEGPQPNGGKF